MLELLLSLLSGFKVGGSVPGEEVEVAGVRAEDEISGWEADDIERSSVSEERRCQLVGTIDPESLTGDE